MANRRLKQIHPTLAYVATHLDDDVSLTALAARARTSPFHLQRLFSAATTETPKQLSLRLRLDQAAAQLLTTQASVLDIALSSGFQSHEVFSRSFRKRFGLAPKAYRERGFAIRVDDSYSKTHATLVTNIGPCVGLYHFTENGEQGSTMEYSITTTEIAPQQVVMGRRRVKRMEISSTIGAVLSHVFQFSQQHGFALAGFPLTRYSEFSAGLLTVEPGMRIASADQTPVVIDPAWTVATGEANVRIDTLPGGTVATTLHIGPYDKLSEAYEALESWIEANGFSVAGSPWECYLTDPAESPDPQNWKTELFWPVKPRA